MTGCSKPLHTGPIPQDAESGTVTPGKESWKKRYLVATSDGQPTLTWYNSDKPGQVKNARELILYEGTCLMEGHNTNAFYKLASKDKPLPRPELCFSMMTTTRSLDMAAESVKDAGKLRGVKELLGL